MVLLKPSTFVSKRSGEKPVISATLLATPKASSTVARPLSNTPLRARTWIFIKIAPDSPPRTADPAPPADLTEYSPRRAPAASTFFPCRRYSSAIPRRHPRPEADRPHLRRLPDRRWSGRS